MDWIEEMIEDAARSRQHRNLDSEAMPAPVRPPAPAPVRPHSLLAWGIVLCCLAIVGIAVWFLNGVKLEW